MRLGLELESEKEKEKEKENSNLDGLVTTEPKEPIELIKEKIEGGDNPNVVLKNVFKNYSEYLDRNIGNIETENSFCDVIKHCLTYKNAKLQKVIKEFNAESSSDTSIHKEIRDRRVPYFLTNTVLPSLYVDCLNALSSSGGVADNLEGSMAALKALADCSEFDINKSAKPKYEIIKFLFELRDDISKLTWPQQMSVKHGIDGDGLTNAVEKLKTDDADSYTALSKVVEKYYSYNSNRFGKISLRKKLNALGLQQKNDVEVQPTTHTQTSTTLVNEHETGLPKERENQSQSAPEPTEKDNLGAVILGNFQGSRADRIKYLLEPQQRSKQGIETAYRLMLERFLADAKTQDHTEDTAYEVAKVILSYDGVKLSKVIETVAKGTQDASASSEIMINFLNNIVLVRLYADALDDIMSENSGAELPNIKKAIQRLAEFPDQKEKVAKQLKTIDFVKELYDSISHLDDAHKATALEKLKVAVEALKNSSACPHETVEAVVKFYYANQSDAAKRERRGLRRHLGTQLNNLNLRSKKDAAYDIQRDFLKWIGFAAENGDFSDHEEYFTSALELAGVHVLNARPLPYAQQHTIFSFALSYFQNQDTAKLNSSGFVKLISLFIQYGPKHDIELYKSFSKAHLLVLWKQLVTDALKLSADGEWDKAGFIFRTLNSIYTHCSSQHPDLSKADVDLLQVLITEKPSTLQASTLEKIQECIREILKIYDQTDDDGEISIQLLKVRDTLNALNTSFGSSTSNYPDRLYVLGLIGKLQDLIAQHQDKALDQLKNKERDLDKEKERKSEETLSVVNNPNTVWGKVASAKPVARLYTVEFIRKQDDFNDDDSDLPTNDL